MLPDQGQPFVNHHARIVCANLGIRLLHANPYHAWSKGKVELRFDPILMDRVEVWPKASFHGLARPADLNLLAQSAWFIAARAAASSIDPDHIHQAIKLVPSAHAKISHP